MLTCASFAFDRDFVDANLWHGYFDIMNLLDDEGNYEKSYSTMDSIDGIYLFVEGGWDGPCCVSPYHLRLSIGKNMMRMQKDSVWILVNSADSDSLNFELKKGNALSLEKFKKLEFDSSHVQYRIDSSNPLELDIDIQKDSSHFYYYVLYQTENSIATLCGIVNAVCYYQIGCIYRNDGSLNFDSLPDPMKLNRIEDCPESGGSSLQPMIRGLKKQNELEQLYKVNGTPVSKGSSNIVFQNKQPKLQLKGKR
jgi:hypothetical protein